MRKNSKRMPKIGEKPFLKRENFIIITKKSKVTQWDAPPYFVDEKAPRKEGKQTDEQPQVGHVVDEEVRKKKNPPKVREKDVGNQTIRKIASLWKEAELEEVDEEDTPPVEEKKTKKKSKS